MASYDINRLRQQAIFEQMPDIMGGMASGGGMGYAPEEDPFQSPQQPMQTAPQLPMQQRPQQQVIPATPPVLRPTAQDSLRMPTPTYGMPQQPSSMDTDIAGMIKAINQVYTPQTRASDRFNNLLDAFPERQNPSLARAIVAGGIGIGSKNPLEDMEKYQYAPYYRDVAAWKEKSGPFQQGASLENAGNIQERTLASNVVTGMWNADKNRIAQQRADETTRTNMAKEEISRQRNAILDAKNRGVKFHTKGERLIALFPDGTTRDAGPTTNWSPFELEDLKQEGRMAVTQQQGANQQQSNTQQGRDILQDKDGNTYRYDASKGRWVPFTDIPAGGLTRPGTTGQGSNQGLSPNEQKQARINRIEAAIDQNPAWADYYDTETGRFVPPSGSLISGVSAQQKMDYDKFRKTVDPNYQSTYTKPPVNPQSNLLPATRREMEAAAGGPDFNIPDIQIGDEVGSGMGGQQKPPQYLHDKRLQLIDAKTGKPVLGKDGKPQYIDPTKEQIAAAARAGYRVK